MAKPNELCELDFQKRGWSASSYFRVDGQIFANGGGKKDTPVYRIEGNWSESAVLIHNKTGEREVTW